MRRGTTVAAAVVLVALLPTTAHGAAQTCLGQRATISGSGGDDTIEGTSGDDVIVGRGGDDLIRGGGGDDVICGGDGVDRIAGGAGSDRMSGGTTPAEDDVVSFRTAPTGVRVDLGAGTARGEGQDSITGFEMVIGSRHGDVMIGDPAAAYEDLRGRGGRDVLVARSAQSTLAGGRGADRLEGGPGDDDFFPGAGDDIVDGAGRGQDVLMFWFSPRPVRVNVGAGTAVGEGKDTFRAVDIVFGSHHDDTLRGSGGRDILNGDVGDDVIRGLGGDDWLFGDADDDRLFGGAGDDKLDGQWELDNLDGGPGTDRCLNGEVLTGCESVL